VKAKLIELTPQRAEQLLERNTHNRTVQTATVDKYARDMRNGDWQINGEAIKISADGQVLDGQHRLMAILEADIPITTLLITGLPAQTQETMDQGRGRTFGDMLKLRGETNATNLAAAVRIVCLFEMYGLPYHSGFSGPAPSPQVLARCLEHNPEIRGSVTLACNQRRSWLQPTIVAAFHYLFASASQEDADDFVEKVLTGTGLDASDPRYLLREKLIKERYENGWMGQKPRMALMIKAWNAFRRGEELARLSWAPGGVNGEKFPAIDGLETRGGGGFECRERRLRRRALTTTSWRRSCMPCCARSRSRSRCSPRPEIRRSRA
jgi:hypothetical protein